MATVSAVDTLRCGNKTVEIGVSTSEVIKYCGKPTSTEIEEHDVRSVRPGQIDLHTIVPRFVPNKER
jgi:hypothetical protein